MKRLDTLGLARRIAEEAAPVGRAVTALLLAYGPLLAGAAPAPVAADPWSRGVAVMRTFFTGPFAQGISLIAVVLGGAMYALDDSGGSKKKLGGLVFGTGLMLLAAQFLNWIFGTTL